MTPEDKQLYLNAAVDQGWRVSPLATAVTLSADDAVPYRSAPHLKILSDVVRRAVLTGGREIISMPPQHGKSWMASKWAPLWFLENWPHKNVINAGYGKEFASTWGRMVRNNIAKHQDRLSFSLAPDSTSANRWNTDQDGGMLCVGVGSGVTGKPAQLLIIDDPVKSAAEASSFTYREGVWQWYVNEARTRVHKGAAILLVMTRWNEDDLAGRLLKRMDEPWRQTVMPAIYDEEAKRMGPDPIGRKLGEPLWASMHGLEQLAVHMRQSAETWSSLFQQRPGTTAGLGNVYGSFSKRGDEERQANVRPCVRDHKQRLVWTLDFNIEPMCSVIAQYKEFFGPQSHLTNEKYKIVEVLDEICVDAMTTREACEEFMTRAEKLCGTRQGILEIYGDPGGRARHTSQVSGSDWDIITNFFREQQQQFEVHICVKKNAPFVKDRTNAVNAMLCNALDEVQTFVDPSCKMLIRDFENVKWKRDTNGNALGQLDKSQKDLTHVSDAWGYFIETKWGREQASGEVGGIMF